MIESYSFGRLVIASNTYHSDVLVLPDRVVPDWWRKEGHLLQLDDLQQALSARPEVLVVGTGAQQCMKVAPEVVAHTQKVGIELLACDTRTACGLFNELSQKRRAVAALHLTC